MKGSLKTYFQHHRQFAIFCAFLGNSLISLSPLFVRYSEVNVATTAFFRFFLSLPLIWVWMMYDQSRPTRHRNPKFVRDYLWLMAAGVFLSCDITLWYLSMQYTTIINSILLNNGCTVIVAVLAWLIFKEKMTTQIVLGIVMAVLGSMLLVGESFELGNPTNLKGDLYALLSAVFYALFIMVTKKLRDQFSTPTIMMWSGFSGVYTLAIIAVVFHSALTPNVPSGYFLLPVTMQGWLILAGLSFFVHVIGQGLMSYSMAHLTATFSALITLVGPIVGAIISYCFFAESLSLIQTIGSIIIILGIVLSQYKRKK